jgi:hypothetical protein
MLASELPELWQPPIRSRLEEKCSVIGPQAREPAPRSKPAHPSPAHQAWRIFAALLANRKRI